MKAQESETLNDETARIEMIYPRPKKRRRLLIFCAVIILLCVGLGSAAWYFRRVTTEPINVEKATPTLALSWLTMRDLSTESPETRDKLFDYYFGALKSAGKTVEGEEKDAPREEADGDEAKSNKNPKSAKPPVLRLPPKLQSMSGMLLFRSDEKLAEWSKWHDRPAYVRFDYVVRPQTPRASEYILSTDVQPGPALKEKWEKRRTVNAQRKSGKTTVESNVQMLVMQWFLAHCEDYDQTPDEEKSAFLENAAVELAGIQGLYNSIRESADKEELPRARMLTEFERQTEGWYDKGEPSEIARALWFKDLLIMATVAGESGGAMKVRPPVIPAKKYQKLLAQQKQDQQEQESSDDAETNSEVREKSDDALSGFLRKVFVKKKDGEN